MKEFLTIKEFAKLSGIEQTTLRYWDEIGLFSPAKRNPDNLYRYYSPKQIIAVNFITVLSSLNIPLKTIGAIESDRSPEKIMELIEQQERRLDMEMQRLRECYSVMHTRLELIRNGLRLEKGVPAGETQIMVTTLEERNYLLGPLTGFTEGETFIEPFMRFCRQAKELRINLSYPIGGFHSDIKHFYQSPGQPERFFSLDPTGNRQIEQGRYLVGYCRGNYGEMGDLPLRMAAYAEEHSLTLKGPVYALYLHDEISLKDVSKYLAKVSIMIGN
ncbi:MAG: MerR family transcriptional regulator [Oscillospiraceae bacterium]|jgi:DNA-binding transcriptional MerR regulator|nr:MerR family transcriptional regulator [Oscillospiraceae bacterium]